SIVTDRVTLGHPCCAGALHCKNPLPNNKSIYCVEHENQKNICAVVNCNQPVVPGCKTCAPGAHWVCEDYHNLMGKAMFQLKVQLERNNTNQTTSAIPPESVGDGQTMSDNSD
ncbi:hypothetical protein K439DRAFT_1234424, partial [Ramaria rubella]